jgi:transcriptional regulator with XRE-family HTH domain
LEFFDMTVNERFGTKLRELRKAAGLTLRELADKVGVNFSYLSKIENGVLPPPSERVIRQLSRVLNFDKDELLALAGIIPADIAEILKDRHAREKLRAEQARKEARDTRGSQLPFPKVVLPWKGLYRLALPVFLVLAVAFSIWFASPTQALTIEYPSQPSTGTLGNTYEFTVKINIQDHDLLPLQSVDVVIYNVNSSSYTATLAAMPLATSSAAAHNPSEGTGSGTAIVSASADSAWGYSASGTGYAYFGYGYSFSPPTSGGYGYQGGTGTTSITYTIIWTPPSSWPAGSYKVRTVLTTSPRSPGGGTTFTQTSGTFTLTSASPVSVGGGGGGATPGDTTYLAGIVTESGVFSGPVTARSADLKVRLDIDKYVIGKNAYGQPIYQIRIAPMAAPPTPPAAGNIIGLPYDITPSGATFEPAITLTFTYDPAALPAGADEANLSLAYFDTATNSWVTLPDTIVDTSNHTASAQISHFTAFAVIAGNRPASFTVSDLSVSPATINPGDTATVTVIVNNTGDLSGSFDAVLRVNDNIVETKKVTLNGRSAQEVTFTISPEIAGTYDVSIDGLSATIEVAALPAEMTTTSTTSPAPVTTTTLSPTTTAAPVPTSTPPATTSTPAPAPMPRPGINWWLIGGIILVVFIVGIVTWQMMFRRVR